MVGVENVVWKAATKEEDGCGSRGGGCGGGWRGGGGWEVEYESEVGEG